MTVAQEEPPASTELGEGITLEGSLPEEPQAPRFGVTNVSGQRQYFGEPISIEGLRNADRAGLRDRTFAAVAALRTRARERLREAGVDPGGID